MKRKKSALLSPQLVSLSLWKLKGVGTGGTMSLSCVRAPLEPLHTWINTPGTRAGPGGASLGLGLCPHLVESNHLLLPKDQRSPLPGKEQMWSPSTKCHTKKQQIRAKLHSLGPGLVGVVVALALGLLGCVCLTPGEDSSSTPPALQGSQNFWF